MLGLGLGGCAVSAQFGSLFGKSNDARAEAMAEDVSGAIGTRQGSSAGLPAETDLVFAKLAIVEVLKRNKNEISSPWENPSSGAHGTVTPIATAYAKDGATCRDFLASYIRRQGSESWLQGLACRNPKGVWEVQSLRPWTRS